MSEMNSYLTEPTYEAYVQVGLMHLIGGEESTSGNPRYYVLLAAAFKWCCSLTYVDAVTSSGAVAKLGKETYMNH